MAKQSKARVFLESITDSGEFLMEAMARTVEYLATFATIYLILEVGITSLQAYAAIHNIALGIILSSPELVMIGAYGMAVREIARGNKGGYALLVSVGVLLLLTFLTVFDLMVWHFDTNGVNVLMAFRFVASIMYAFTRGVVTSKHHVPPAEQQESFDPWAFIGWGAKIEQMIEQIRADLTKQVAEMASTHQTSIADLAQRHQSALVGLVDEDRLANVIDLQVHKWNLTDLQLQRVLSEIQALQSVDISIPTIDYDAVTQRVLTHLRDDFDAWKQAQLDALPDAPQPQIDAPKNASKPMRQNASKSKNDASTKILTMRQPGASTTGKKERIHALLDEDMSLSSYRLATLVGCSEPTARRIKNEYIDAHHDASHDASDPRNTDAVETIILTHDALRHDA